jgi:sulfatase maturation enzyme AslB (radical SAM superfamily)
LEFAVGDIATGEAAALGTPELWRRCAECAYSPLCGDGCMYGAYMRYGDPARLNCPKEYVEYVVRENLKSQYEEASRLDSTSDSAQG